MVGGVWIAYFLALPNGLPSQPDLHLLFNLADPVIVPSRPVDP